MYTAAVVIYGEKQIGRYPREKVILTKCSLVNTHKVLLYFSSSSHLKHHITHKYSQRLRFLQSNIFMYILLRFTKQFLQVLEVSCRQQG